MTPTRSEIEMELQLRRDHAIRNIGKSHVLDGSCRGDKADLGSSSSRVSHIGKDHDLLKRMDGLEESMKLIIAALNIKGMENRKTTNEDVGAAGENIYTGNLMNDNTDVEPYINCTQPDAMKNDVIVVLR